MAETFLLTGNPGCGKTTIIKQILSELSQPAGGFYTQEIRVDGIRKGFEIITLGGQRGILAHVEQRSRHRIGKYGVDLVTLEEVGVAALERALADQLLMVIDEIGPMEILSSRFCSIVRRAIHSDARILGTIVKRPNPFSDQIKLLPQVRLIEVTLANRAALKNHLLSQLEKGQNTLRT
jgi:nucleoside-triphosphatase